MVFIFLSFTVQRMDLFTSKRKNMTFERTALWDLDNLKGYSHLAFPRLGIVCERCGEWRADWACKLLGSLLWEFQAHLLGTPRQVNGESYALVGSSSFHAASTDSDWKVKKPDGNPPLNLE